MNKIRNFLNEQGYDFYEMDGLFEGYSKYIRFLIIKKDYGYLVRNAILCNFDRWANSGCEFEVNTEDEVIGYFKDNTRCIKDAVSELTKSIIEECGWSGDNDNIDRMIEYLYSLVEGE